MPENNDNIPLDQMMRKLKKGSVQKRSVRTEGGEHVIRADGSKAIKIKSNKRRSIQPKQEKERKSNKRKVVLIVAVVALLILSVIAFTFLLGYFNGNRFKSKVTETIVNVSGAEVELGKLDVSPDSAKLSKVDLKWSGEDTLIKALKFKNINANYGMLALVGGGWGGSAVGIETADLVIEMAKNIPRLNTVPERPIDFKFGLYRCSELNVDFGKDSLWNFEKGSVSYRLNDENDDQVSIDSGDLNVPIFGAFKVQAGLVSFNFDGAQVFLDLKPEGQVGSVTVDGTVGYTEGSPVDLKTELKGYALRDWMDPRARRFFSGGIQTGKGTLKMKLGDIDSFDITTKITSRLIKVTDFDFIKTLGEYLQADYYLRPDFVGESKMTMLWTKGRIEFTDIDLLQEAQMRIKGNFIIDENDQLSGTLKVGLPVTVLSTKRGKVLKEVFSEDDGEYIWADVTIGGKASTPSDDLGEMLQAASIKESGIKDGEEIESPEQKFKRLTE